jgi:hypothetical protein
MVHVEISYSCHFTRGMRCPDLIALSFQVVSKDDGHADITPNSYPGTGFALINEYIRPFLLQVEFL